jgi:hypothetical protein
MGFARKTSLVEAVAEDMVETNPQRDSWVAVGQTSIPAPNFPARILSLQPGYAMTKLASSIGLCHKRVDGAEVSQVAVRTRHDVVDEEPFVKFGDYAPPSTPSLAQQQDALRKGLGRALLWASRACLDEAALLEACLRDQRFDSRAEECRGAWLWELIRAVGGTERFRVPILHALYELSDDSSANQLCELARCYAETGDETFRTRLYEIVEQKPFTESAWLGEYEVVWLDGIQGFLFAARVRGKQLADRAWEWDDGSLIDLARERFGEEHVGGLLEASGDEALRRFRESWRQERQRKTEGSEAQSRREQVAATPVDEVLRAAEGTGRCIWLRSWGKHASEEALQTVLQYLWAAREPRVLANLLQVLSPRALPTFDARLIELCRHGDEAVRRWAFAALEENAHPLVREFALAEAQKGLRAGSVVALFRNNYQPRDEHRILEALDLPADADELHRLLMDVVKVLEQNPEADCSRLGILSYALTPCAACRFWAARLLLDRHIAPGWLIEECRYDSEKDCRELVEKTPGSTATG